MYNKMEKPLPNGWALDKDGHASTDAPDVLANIVAKKGGYGSAGIATAIGFDPSMAFLPNVGTIIASEFVQAIPRSPSSHAIFA